MFINVGGRDFLDNEKVATYEMTTEAYPNNKNVKSNIIMSLWTYL